jgi:hypothetical protein
MGPLGKGVECLGHVARLIEAAIRASVELVVQGEASMNLTYIGPPPKFHKLGATSARWLEVFSASATVVRWQTPVRAIDQEWSLLLHWRQSLA